MRDISKLKKELEFRRIIEWKPDYLILDNGTKVTIICSDQDCCACAGGTFENVKLDAVITDVRLEKGKHYPIWEDGEETESAVEVVIYHNQNKVAQAQCVADNGNGDYYYSVCALKVGEITVDVLDSYEYV